jgi:hypothetical protein
VDKDFTRQCVLFAGLFGTTLAVEFDQREGSSDGGAVQIAAEACELG